MPHPQLQPALARMQLPDDIEALSFRGADVQDRYAHTAVLVTDYSSVAFNLAVLDRSVVYYQFDRDDEGSGAHIGRPGYFDYERDGFGPVALDHDRAVAAIVAAIEARGRPSPEYQARIDRTFPNRDGHACERVVAAHRGAESPVPTRAGFGVATVTGRRPRFSIVSRRPRCRAVPARLHRLDRGPGVRGRARSRSSSSTTARPTICSALLEAWAARRPNPRDGPPSARTRAKPQPASVGWPRRPENG